MFLAEVCLAHLAAGFCAQQAEPSAASCGGVPASQAGRAPSSHTAAQICASSSPACAALPCHISHTAHTHRTPFRAY